MNTAQNKLNLVQMIIESEDSTFVKKMLNFAFPLKSTNKAYANYDNDDNIPDYVINEVNESIIELDNGTDKGIGHEEMLKKFRKKYPYLDL